MNEENTKKFVKPDIRCSFYSDDYEKIKKYADSYGVEITDVIAGFLHDYLVEKNIEK